jgi:hypothetical protein
VPERSQEAAPEASIVDEWLPRLQSVTAQRQQEMTAQGIQPLSFGVNSATNGLIDLSVKQNGEELGKVHINTAKNEITFNFSNTEKALEDRKAACAEALEACMKASPGGGLTIRAPDDPGSREVLNRVMADQINSGKMPQFDMSHESNKAHYKETFKEFLKAGMDPDKLADVLRKTAANKDALKDMMPALELAKQELQQSSAASNVISSAGITPQQLAQSINDGVGHDMSHSSMQGRYEASFKELMKDGARPESIAASLQMVEANKPHLPAMLAALGKVAPGVDLTAGASAGASPEVVVGPPAIGRSTSFARSLSEPSPTTPAPSGPGD